MNRAKTLVSVLLEEMNLTPKELKELTKKYNLDERQERTLKFIYRNVKKSKNTIKTFDNGNCEC